MKLQSKVTVTANPETGEVFTKNATVSAKDGKQYGFIRLQQETVELGSALGQTKVRSALKSFEEGEFNKAAKLLKDGVELDGRIVREETTQGTEMFGDGLGWTEKRAGDAENAPVCKLGNKAIYQRTRYSENANEADTLVQHTNTEEIKSFQEVTAASAVINK